MNGIGTARVIGEAPWRPAPGHDPRDAGASTLLTIMRLINEEASAGEPTFDLQMRQLIEFVSLQLQNRRSSRPAQTSRTPRGGLARWQVKRVTAYMCENIEKDVDLQKLADVVSLSRFYFCSAFRMATGYTPHEWLTRLRMDEAQRLLGSSPMPITDIALAVGYQTPSAFAATFRRVVGVSPREFRRKL